MSANTRVRNKTHRRIFEGVHQLHTEYLWKSFKEVMDIDIFKGFFTLVTDKERCQYLESLEGLFIQKSLTRRIPKHIVLKSNAYNCVKQLTRKRDLDPSNFRRTITQLEICAQKKVRHSRLI
tara:strand:+ start:575 stop:940 length:366 start_codon:yes stop_codon:yes gene_type:complete